MSPPIVYIDVDDTFVRSVGTKRIPMPNVIRHIRDLKEQGATLYCWSSGGAEYAQASAREFGLEDCFEAFLPKPHLLVDDQEPHEWRGFKVVHPSAL
ncbi:hypothetical protein IAD21_03857 [Abditibacteriota bacterium]|nr:hypothetical protein IAD21_03857 [Abditibacteriota bacterium]